MLRHAIPPCSGFAWEIPAGHVCRLSIVEGPQVLDLNLWNRAEPAERFWASRTRQFHGAHLKRGDSLWSTLPWLRPLATMVTDTIAYEIDEDGAGCHDLLGTRCDPYAAELLTGEVAASFCHTNLREAISGYGLAEADVHDVVNLFQVAGLRRSDQRYFMKPSPARQGDHVELLAHIDLLAAGSTCPGGDQSGALWADEPAPSRNPILVEVFAPIA